MTASKKISASTRSRPTERWRTVAFLVKSTEEREKECQTACESICRETFSSRVPRGIWIWDAQGHHLGTIVVPEQPANLTWGDADYKTLYITATHVSL